MYFDILIGSILFLFFLIGLARYALRSFLAFLMLALYVTGLYFFPEAVSRFQPQMQTLGDFTKSFFSVALIYFAVFLILSLLSSVISSAYYKKRKDAMTAPERTTSKMISLFFALLQGGLFCSVIIGVLIFTLRIYGESLPVPRDWLENSYVLKYTVPVFSNIPEKQVKKFEPVTSIITALVNSEAREVFVRSESFQKFQELSSVLALAERVYKMQNEGQMQDSYSTVQSLFSLPEMKDLLKDGQAYSLLSSKEFIEDARKSLDSIKELDFDFNTVQSLPAIKPDTLIILKNGNQVECRIIREDKNKVFVVFGQDGITAEFSRQEIEKIIPVTE